jgi:hypothetical protein
LPPVRGVAHQPSQTQWHAAAVDYYSRGVAHQHSQVTCLRRPASPGPATAPTMPQASLHRQASACTDKPVSAHARTRARRARAHTQAGGAASARRGPAAPRPPAGPAPHAEQTDRPRAPTRGPRLPARRSSTHIPLVRQRAGPVPGLACRRVRASPAHRGRPPRRPPVSSRPARTPPPKSRRPSARPTRPGPRLAHPDPGRRAAPSLPGPTPTRRPSRPRLPPQCKPSA